MKRKMRMILIMIGMFGFWILLFWGIDLARAKDPDYPTKPINCYIPWAAGGTVDTSVRALIEAAGKYLGQSIIPINKTGGAGTVGAMTVMNAKPDGYTLGANVGSLVFVMPHSEASPYKDLNGFTLIMNYGRFVFPVIVRSDAPWKTWKEFIEWARQNPRAAKVGTTGARSVSPMPMALWKAEQKEKVEFTYIIYQGSALVISATLGGHITLEASSIDPARIEYLKTGKLRILAYLSKEKVPGYENVPTFHELYGFEPPNLMGIWGPKGIPEYVLEKLDDAFAKAVKDPSFVGVMNRMYTPVVYMNRAEVNRHVREEFPKVGEIIKILRAEEAKEKK